MNNQTKRVYKAVIAFFPIVFAAMMWPIHPLFSLIHPMVLGLPFSLIYLILLIAVSFLALLGLYLWENRQDETP